ncbi:MAG: hypothetical protein FWB74_07455 [Defluviitaleaceae bacterium]|nr:hypothetical protein [Defluviitaleaceae bacterium]
MHQTFTFHIHDKHKEKPVADISMATDYDQRYLEIISKIFYKELTDWDCKQGYELNKILAEGGQIALYWHKMRLVGAAVYQLIDNNWKLLHIAFKSKEQGSGHGKVLLDFVMYKIYEFGGTHLTAQVSNSQPLVAGKFFKKYEES